MSVLADLLFERVNPIFITLQKEIQDLKEVNNALHEKIHQNLFKKTNVAETQTCSKEDDHAGILINAKDTTANTNLCNKDDSMVQTSGSNKETLDGGKNVDTIEYFLCSIEKALTVDDVKLILSDACVPIENIQLMSPKGEFKNKKYLKVYSTSNVDLFNFRMAFQNSKLNGTWFLRMTPPKFHIVIDTSKQSNDHTNITQNYSSNKTLHKPHTKNYNNNHTNKKHFLPHNEIETQHKGLLPTPPATKKLFTNNMSQFHNKKQFFPNPSHAPINSQRNPLNHGPNSKSTHVIPFLENLLVQMKNT